MAPISCARGAVRVTSMSAMFGSQSLDNFAALVDMGSNLPLPVIVMRVSRLRSSNDRVEPFGDQVDYLLRALAARSALPA